jgi:hypothetical protein
MGEGAWSGPLLGLRVSVRLLSPGIRDCVEPAQRKVGQRTDRSRRRRVARISASATLSSSSWVVSVLAWPRRRRTASMDTPELKLLGGVGVTQLVDLQVGPGRAAARRTPVPCALNDRLRPTEPSGQHLDHLGVPVVLGNFGRISLTCGNTSRDTSDLRQRVFGGRVPLGSPELWAIAGFP